MAFFAERGWRWLKRILWACGLVILLLVGLIAFLFAVVSRVPTDYPRVANPIEPPSQFPGRPAGYASPYIGHTGSWDGKGGGLWGSSKIPELDAERAMHLRWTFMPVYWSAMEPRGPVDLTGEIPPAWRELDGFVVAAHERGLNILMQAPVVGGNAGGPPAWAGRREKGKSAPANMDAAAAFAGKLAARYAPGGTLARQQGWNLNYGVCAWELDNEPDGYLTHWKNQAGDYAEFATRCAQAIRQTDPYAFILGPAVMGGGGACDWIKNALDAQSLNGSPTFHARAVPYSIGPVVDGVSFHLYEGLDSAFSGKNRTVGPVFMEVREIFEQWEKQAPGFDYSKKQQYWHTEGDFNFFGVLSKKRLASWRLQFFTRAFAAGVSKVAVMDASKPEQIAVRAYVDALPNPFPMRCAEDDVKVLSGRSVVFRHMDGPAESAGRVWVLWAANADPAVVEVPVRAKEITLISIDGRATRIKSAADHVTVRLEGDAKIAPPLLLIDREM